jgi:HSP20 family protein
MNKINNLVDELFSPFNKTFAYVYNERPVNCVIGKDGDTSVISISLPGFKKKNVSIDVEGDILKIVGTESESNKYAFSFEKTFTISSGMDTESVRATLEDGILKITMNKIEGYSKKVVIS